jgi:hypothetical protein
MKAFIYGLISIGLLLAPDSSLANQGDRLRLSCSTQPGTTTYQIFEDDQHYYLVIFHHFGVEYMPIHNGVVTPNFLSQLQKRSEALKLMGESNRVKIDKDNCQFKQQRWSCMQEGPIRLNQLLVKTLYFNTYHMEQTMNQSYTWFSTDVSLSLRLEDDNITISLPFYGDDCRHY